jgi:hypothetical protein
VCGSRHLRGCVGAALPYSTSAQSSAVRGLYNWIHSTGDAERSFAFYHDLFGVELSRSPFAGPAPADAPPERIRPAAEAGSDPLVWDLTNTHGSRFRTVFMRAPNTSFGLELSEFFDVPRGERPPNPWDPGRRHARLHRARPRRSGVKLKRAAHRWSRVAETGRHAGRARHPVRDP